jgi:glycosyltransferase involved in cell wall biosynthesis
MACGTPTILAAGSSLPEVGGDAAAYFTPGSADELTQAMTSLAGDDAARRELSAAGVLRAGQFTWERTAANTAAVYRATLEG